LPIHHRKRRRLETAVLVDREVNRGVAEQSLANETALAVE